MKKNLIRVVCVLIVFYGASLPGRDHMLLGDGPCAAPGCPVPLPEPPPVKVPVVCMPDPPAPLVTIKVRVPACLPPGEPLEYHIFVENCSPLPAHHVTVRNCLPPNARFVKASPVPHAIEPEIIWQLGTLAGRGCKEIVLVLDPAGPDDITNCTRVQFEHGQCVTTHLAGRGLEVPGQPGLPRMPPADREPGTIPAPPQPPEPPQPPPTITLAKLQLTVNGPARANVGQPVRYNITVTNIGTAPATNVLVDSTLSAKLTFVSASDEGKFLENKVAWLLGDLPIGASKSVELAVRAREAGEICFRTRVLADKGLATEVDTCTLFAGEPPSAPLLLEMYDRDDPITLGGNTSYPIRVQNQGQVPVTNLRIVADLPDGMDFDKANGPVAHKTQGKSIVFEALVNLEPGARVDYEVFTRAVAVGQLTFRIQMTADQLQEGGPVLEEESTTVYDEDNPPPQRVRMQSVKRRPRIILLDMP